MSPPISLFLTTIASQPVLRKRQEYLLRILQAKKIPFTSYDLASDQDAKRLWKRKAPLDKQQLPGYLVGYQFVGTFNDFEEAVEYNELDRLLQLNEPWDPEVDELRPPPAAKTIGVPGAVLPMQMTPDHIRKHIIAEQQSPLRIKNKPSRPVNREGGPAVVDVGNELSGYGLQGVTVTEDELKDLMADLGLGDDEANDLAKGLVGSSKESGSSKGTKALATRKPKASEVKEVEKPSEVTEAEKPKTEEDTTEEKGKKKEVVIDTNEAEGNAAEADAKATEGSSQVEESNSKANKEDKA
ncbi:hypothetical protein FA15DRAFT_662844 [Coprinopsis marcescibilis]|uniref:Uncharacterized protein n=1 Tax=Coprinopsis marcescibilis TaxID=230819 RepID=A0A5C3LCK0_COPMA|nr:hypothetical protein FA15DRAFT_662844 [Coprinopsis marcescibilis]